MRRLIAVVTATLIIGCQASPSPSPSAGEVVTPSSPVTPTTPPTTSPPTPTEAPPSTSASWEQVADLEAFDGRQLVEVTWTGARFVASSGDFMLASPDGRTWHRGQPIQSFGFPEFAVGPGGVVAVADATSWFSADGLEWTPARRTKALRPEDGRALALAGVVATDAGWLAVGSDSAECFIECGPGGSVPAVWRSDDGITWVRVATTGLDGEARFIGVARTEGGFVGVGDAEVGRRIHAAVWLSADGATWNRVPDSTVFGAPPDVAQHWVGMTDVVAASDVVVAVGQAFTQDLGGSALAWYSTDRGTTWQRAVGERFVGGQLFAAAAIPGGFVATGPSGRTSCWGGIWLSPDGASWDCVAEDRSFNKFAAYAGAASPTTLVVVGFGGAERKLDAAVWVHELSSLEALPSRD